VVGRPKTRSAAPFCEKIFERVNARRRIDFSAMRASVDANVLHDK